MLMEVCSANAAKVLLMKSYSRHNVMVGITVHTHSARTVTVADASAGGTVSSTSRGLTTPIGTTLSCAIPLIYYEKMTI